MEILNNCKYIIIGGLLQASSITMAVAGYDLFSCFLLLDLPPPPLHVLQSFSLDTLHHFQHVFFNSYYLVDFAAPQLIAD